MVVRAAAAPKAPTGRRAPRGQSVGAEKSTQSTGELGGRGGERWTSVRAPLETPRCGSHFRCSLVFENKRKTYWRDHF